MNRPENSSASVQYQHSEPSTSSKQSENLKINLQKTRNTSHPNKIASNHPNKICGAHNQLQNKFIRKSVTQNKQLDSSEHFSELQHEILDQWPKVGVICGVEMSNRRYKTAVSILELYLN